MREDPERIVHSPKHLCGVKPFLREDQRNNLVFPHCHRVVVVSIVSFITDNGILRSENPASFEFSKHLREEPGIARRPPMQEKRNRKEGGILNDQGQFVADIIAVGSRVGPGASGSG